MSVWTQADIDALPDSSFLVVDDGGTKDSQAARFPAASGTSRIPAGGKVDLPHVRNALARIPQSDLPQAVKDRATKEAQRILDRETRTPRRPSNGEIMRWLATLKSSKPPRATEEVAAFQHERLQRRPAEAGQLLLSSLRRLRRHENSDAKNPGAIAARSEPGVGHTDQIGKAGHCLNASGIVSGDTPAAKDVVSSAANGFPWQASISASIERREFVPGGSSRSQVNGQIQAAGPCIIARESTLRRTDVLRPRGRSYHFREHRQQERHNEMETRTSPDNLDSPPDLNEAQRLDGFRLAAIAPYEGRVAGLPQIQARAIEENWTLRDFGTTRDSRRPRPRPGARVPAFHAGGEPRDVFRPLRRSACWAKSRSSKSGYGAAPGGRPATCESTAWRNSARHQFLADGRDLPAGGRGAVIEAAFTTACLPGILSNAMNKILLTQYQAVDSVAKKVGKKLTANDFKVHTGYRLTGDATLQPVGPNGELAHGTLAESAYPFSVGTFGRIYGITRQMMKNDDLGSLYEIPGYVRAWRCLGRRKGVLDPVAGQHRQFLRRGQQQLHQRGDHQSQQRRLGSGRGPVPQPGRSAGQSDPAHARSTSSFRPRWKRRHGSCSSAPT